jgi:uncharacterized membrane protein
MVKQKKNISSFRDALKNNAEYLSRDHMPEIDPKLVRQYKMLAQYKGQDLKAMMEQALKHFLRLKTLDLQAAEEAMLEQKNKGKDK